MRGPGAYKPHTAMKLRRILVTLFACAATAFVSVPTVIAVTFTNDTLIDPLNTNFDGTDVVITNCTVTIDGPHGFNSLSILPGGKLTHSFSPNGLITNIIVVVDEPQVLNGTNPVPLLNTN